MPPAVRRALDGAALAVTFLTVLPLRVREGVDGGGSAPAWYGLVGAPIGPAAGGAYAAAEPGLGRPVAAVLAVVTLVVVTGGLHQDGLADCADGTGVRGDRERRLAVMRDPTIGTFGALALVLWALLLTTALAQLAPGEVLAALATAAAAGRVAALLHARWTRSARREGLGSAFAPSLAATVIAGLVTLGIAAAVDLAHATPAALAAVPVAGVVSLWSRRALGGRTGDTLGATVALTEVAVVLVTLALTA